MRRAVSRLTWWLVLAAVFGQPLAAGAANVVAQFDGLSNDDNALIAGVAVLPPDNGLAVGTNNIFQMENVVGQITDKLGATVSSFSLNSFFAVDTGFGESDPRVIYDAISGRWFGTYLQFSFSARLSSIILAVSTTSDPTGTFCRYRLGNPTSETFLQDFPMLGVSDDKVIVSYNGFSFAKNNPFVGAGIYVLNKADLLACASVRRVRMAPDPTSFTPQPAQALGSTSDAYLSMHSQASSTLTLLKVSGIPGVSTVTSTPTLLTVRSWTPPPSAPQAGSSVALQTNGDGVLSVAWQNNSLWLAGNEACTPPGDTAVRSCLRVIEVRTDTASVRQDMTFGVAQKYYFYPALRPDSAGNVYVVFTSSSASDFASVRATGRLATDPLNTLQASNVIQAGGGAQTDSSGRMGDYSGAAIDPSDPLSVWVSGEFIRSTSEFDWGTYVAQLRFSTPVPVLTALSPSSAFVGGAGFTLTVTGGSFVPSSVVRWNGLDRATTFVSSTRLQAAIPASDIAAAGSAQVTVFSPLPDGGTSSALAFPIQVPLTLTALTTDKTAPQPIGTTITFTASTSGGVAPLQYKWWVFDGTTWTVAQNWTTSNTFAWTPTAPNGNSQVGVWVRSATNTADSYDRLQSTGSVPFATFSTLTLGSLTADKSAPQPPGTTITWTATATGGAAPYSYKWWVFDGTTWTVVQNWTTSNTYVWTPTVANSNYQVGVWVRSAGVTADTYDRVQSTGSVAFVIGSGPLTLTSLTADKTAPQPPGTTITWTTTATGGTTPYSYKWWVFDGTTWTVVQNWSTSNTYVWTPTVANPNYQVGVWIRSAGVTADTYDSVQSTRSVPFAIGYPALILTSLTADKTAPQPPGTTITWTTTATGGTTPYSYKWWVFDGTTWTVVQNWSTSNTYVWTPTVANPNYQVGVWIRSATNTADTFDSVQSTRSVPFAIGSNLTLTSLTPDKTAPQPPGTTITWTATATGGTAPYSYKWWVFDGTTWVVVQYWTASNTYAWTPTVANPNYQVGVWIRSAGVTADTYDRVQSTGSTSFPIQ